MQMWIQHLQTRQEEFIRRLEHCLIPENQHLYSFFKEQVYISEKYILGQISDFSKKKTKYKIENNFLGKLGEAAIKKFVGDTLISDNDKSDLLSPVDCQLYLHGDGGSDFSVLPSQYNTDLRRSHINTDLQIKTTRLATHGNIIRELKWRFSEKEISKNRVLICNFIYQDLKLNNGSYYVMISGFIFRERVLENLRNKKWQY